MRLDPAALEPRWITVRAATDTDPEVRVRMAPIGQKAWRAAQAAVSRGIAAAGGVLTDEVTEDLGDAMSLALIKAGLLEWQGVGDLAGEPIAPTHDIVERDGDGVVIATTPGTISLFLADPRDFDAIDAEYVIPFMDREREKNGSPPLSLGTTSKATAVPDTASSPASPIATDDVQRAPTPPKSRRPKKAR